MNPFNEKPCKIEKCVADWRKIYPTAYDKNDADAYTKVRAILLNGAEFEESWLTTCGATWRFCADSNSNNKNEFRTLNPKTNLCWKRPYLTNNWRSI